MLNGEDEKPEDEAPDIRKAPLVSSAFIKRLFIFGIVVVLTLFGRFLYIVTHTASTRSPVTRVRADQRTFGTAIEAYFVDHNSFPAWSADPALNVFGKKVQGDLFLPMQPTFMIGDGKHLMTLTTPIAYMNEYFVDPFAPVAGAPFCYWSVAEENKRCDWIIWSAGPDRKYDLTLDNIKNIADFYDFEHYAPSRALIELTYDPTNGTTSGGDIYRIRQ